MGAIGGTLAPKGSTHTPDMTHMIYVPMIRMRLWGPQFPRNLGLPRPLSSLVSAVGVSSGVPTSRPSLRYSHGTGSPTVAHTGVSVI